MATLCDAMPPEEPMVGDEEELVGDDFSEAFASTPYHLAHSTLSLNKAYVLHVSASVGHSRHRFGTKMLVDRFESRVQNLPTFTPKLTRKSCANIREDLRKCHHALLSGKGKHFICQIVMFRTARERLEKNYNLFYIFPKLRKKNKILEIANMHF